MNNLKKKDIDFFLENGYLAIGKIIDDDFLKKLQLEYDKEFIKGNINKTIRNLSKKDDFGEEINKLNKVLKNGMTLNVIEKNCNGLSCSINSLNNRMSPISTGKTYKSEPPIPSIHTIRLSHIQK